MSGPTQSNFNLSNVCPTSINQSGSISQSSSATPPADYDSQVHKHAYVQVSVPVSISRSTPAATPTPSGRKRFISSCSTCRRRKVRCDREKPMCARCTISGYPCGYTDSDAPITAVPPAVVDSPQEHGPSPANSTSTYPGQHVQFSGTSERPHGQDLLQRLQRLEEIVAAYGSQQTPAPRDSIPGYSPPTVVNINPSRVTVDSSPPETSKNPADTLNSVSSTGLQAGKLLNDGGRVRYVSPLYWELITDEIQNLSTEVYDQHSDSTRLHPDTANRSPWYKSPRAEPRNGFGPNAATLIFPGPAPSSGTPPDIHSTMPPLPEVHHLFTIFQYRIDPLIRLLHIPTFMASMEIYFEFDINPVGHYHNPGTNIPLTKSESTTVYLGYSIASFEALLFAVIYAAIHALSSHELIQHVEDGRITHNIQKPSHHETNRKSDEDLKTQLLRYYRFATEQSLVRARFLESSDTVSVMALTILLICTCQESDVPTLYPLTGLLLRIAQSLGLHRDPCLLFSSQAAPAPSKNKQRNMTKQSISPIEAETRRRLWHHICHLDLRASEAHGPDPGNFLEEEMWPAGPATCFPRCIDDGALLDNIKADTDIITPDHPSFYDPGRFTRMSMQLLRFNASLCFRRLLMPAMVPFLALGAQLQGRDTIEELLRQRAKAEVEAMVEVNKKYLQYCNDDDGMDEVATLKRLTKALANVVENKVRILYYYRFEKGRETASPEARWALRESVLLQALDMLQTFNNLCLDPAMYPYHWHIDAHIPFHALCHLLTELCTPEFRQEKHHSIRERARDLLHSLDWVRDQGCSEENPVGSATRRGKEWDFVRKLIRRAEGSETGQPLVQHCDGPGNHIQHDGENIGVETVASQNHQSASNIDSQFSFLTELGTGQFAWNDTTGIQFDQDDWDQITRLMYLDPFSFM